MRPIGAHSVAPVAMYEGASRGWRIRPFDPTVFDVAGAFPVQLIADAIRANPKYSLDLFTEKIRYTFVVSRYASFKAASLCGCVTQVAVCKLSSKSCKVRLLRTKNFSNTL